MANERVLDFHPLSFVPEGDDVVVGRVDTGSYAVLPVDGAELLRRLSDGLEPAQAAQWYESTFGEPVDIDDFVDSLGELGFVRTAAEAVVVPKAPRLQWLGRALFSPVAWLCYLALLISWMVFALPHGDIRPSSSQLFFTSSVLAVQLTVMLGQLPFIFLHESFHVLAGQRAGLSSKLNISNRFTFVVIETQSNGLLSLPRRRRYLPFLAGMVFDLIAVSVLDLIAQLSRHSDGSLSPAGKLCLAFSFAVLTRIAWQFLLYLKTDLYFVLAAALNCHDLHDASTALFMNRIWRLLRRDNRLVDESQWTSRDLRVGRWYGWFLAVGLLTMAGVTCFVTVPVLVTFVHRVAVGLTAGAATVRFWDALLFVSLNVLQFALPAYLARRKRRLDAARAPRLLNPGVI